MSITSTPADNKCHPPCWTKTSLASCSYSHTSSCRPSSPLMSTVILSLIHYQINIRMSSFMTAPAIFELIAPSIGQTHQTCTHGDFVLEVQLSQSLYITHIYAQSIISILNITSIAILNYTLGLLSI